MGTRYIESPAPFLLIHVLLLFITQVSVFLSSSYMTQNTLRCVLSTITLGSKCVSLF